MMNKLCIPRDVMERLDSAWSRQAFHPHLHTNSIEEIWVARGVAKVMMDVLQMYREYHGEDYVPRLFTPTDTTPSTGPASGPSAYSEEGRGSP